MDNEMSAEELRRLVRETKLGFYWCRSKNLSGPMAWHPIEIIEDPKRVGSRKNLVYGAEVRALEDYIDKIELVPIPSMPPEERPNA